MKQRQGFKFQVRPNGKQNRQMNCFAGSCRFVYNKALEMEKDYYQKTKKRLGYHELAGMLVDWKRESDLSFLNDAPSQTLQQSLKDLEQAYAHFFKKRAAFPRFKKKGKHDSFRFPQGYRLDQENSRLFLPKVGWIRYRKSRDVYGEIKNVTVSCWSGKWFVSIQTEREGEPIEHSSRSIVGIDVGITRFATFSDGTYVEPLHSFKRHQKRLAKAQRGMAKKTKWSQNWKKAKRRIQRYHVDISNARRDFLHKLTHTISQNHAIVCIEDLQVKNMSKSAAGTHEQPGRHVRAKSGLNRSILDQGWFEFRRQLEYKLNWNGGRLITVPPRNTSRMCPNCRHTSSDNRQTQEAFACVLCGYTNNADFVGALNIVAAGHAVCACGETVQCGHSVKQEPTEVPQAVFA